MSPLTQTIDVLQTSSGLDRRRTVLRKAGQQSFKHKGRAKGLFRAEQVFSRIIRIWTFALKVICYPFSNNVLIFRKISCFSRIAFGAILMRERLIPVSNFRSIDQRCPRNRQCPWLSRVNKRFVSDLTMNTQFAVVRLNLPDTYKFSASQEICEVETVVSAVSLT